MNNSYFLGAFTNTILCQLSMVCLIRALRHVCAPVHNSSYLYFQYITFPHGKYSLLASKGIVIILCFSKEFAKWQIKQWSVASSDDTYPENIHSSQQERREIGLLVASDSVKWTLYFATYNEVLLKDPFCRSSANSETGAAVYQLTSEGSFASSKEAHRSGVLNYRGTSA